MREQITDIIPGFFMAVVVGSIVLITGEILPAISIIKLLVQLITAGILIFGLSELFKLPPYLEIKDIVKLKVIAAYNARK